MRKKLLFLALVLASALVSLQTSVRPAEAASGCWQVDCNTCCKLQGGPIVCTERACVEF